jgi:pyrimidine operon attenuation protein/uracil phosphoribosyltransferase
MSAQQILTADEMRLAFDRIAEAILASHGGTDGLMLVGIERRGPQLAERIAAVIRDRVGVAVPIMALDVAPFRDDRGGAIDADAAAVIPNARLRAYDAARTTVVLVDDVLFTGRTVRAALDALMDGGRPAAVRLAVLVDRGHRELPISADFVGLSLPTTRDERVELRLAGAGADEDGAFLQRSSARTLRRGAG